MDEREAFLENYEKFLQQLGQGQTAGRILGLLMIGEKGEMTLDELADKVGRSKSTIHTSVKSLTDLGMIEKTVDDSVKSEGRYPHYFSFKKDFFEYSLKQIDKIHYFKKLIADAITFLKEDGIEDGRIEAYEKTYALYGWYQEKLEEFFDEWQELIDTGDYRKYLDIEDT